MNGFIQPAIAFAATIVLIIALRPLAFRYGLTDRPDERKVHKGEMPLIGGIAIYFAILCAVALPEFLFDDYQHSRETLAFFAGATLLMSVGVWDDWLGLSPLLRFLVQIGAGLIMVYGGGIMLVDLGALGLDGSQVTLGLLAVPFTVFVTVGMINAINMCDGLDGLSGNMTLVLLAGLGLANSFWGTADHLEMLNVVSAAVAGFLVFNQRSFLRNRAWIFLGDAGSMVLGFTLAWCAVDITQSYPPIVAPAAVLWFLAVPVFDTVTMMLRRIARGTSPFQADSEHLHHLLVRSGFSVGGTIGVMCLFSAVCCAVGLVSTWLRVPDFAVAAGFMVTGLVYLYVINSAWKKGRFLGREIAARPTDGSRDSGIKVPA